MKDKADTNIAEYFKACISESEKDTSFAATMSVQDREIGIMKQHRI
jgi:hypothetical protein